MHPSEHAKNTPAKPAYIMAPSGEVVTFAQLEERSIRGARFLRSAGIQAGDHIAIYMENNRQYMQIVWSAQMSHVKCPKSVDFAESLPRLENGKLHKREVVRRYERPVARTTESI